MRDRGLNIHLGPRDPVVAMKVRAATPAGAWLLYIHPGESLCVQAKGAETCKISEALPRLARLVETLGLDDGMAVWTSSSCGVDKDFPGVLDSLREQASRSLSGVRCLRAGRLLFMRAAIQNLPSLAKNGRWHVASPQSFKGHGVILCGAGPSLKRALPELLRLHSTCALIAVGRACKTLLDAGIRPDAVCEMDPLCHVNWPSGLTVSAPLIAPLLASPDVASRFETVLWTSAEQYSSRLGVSLPEARLARSVGVYALDVALKLLGFEEAALVGFDLCLGSDGSSHAGTPAVDDGDAGSLVKVAGREGGEVLANSLFNGMREAFENHPAMKAGKVFNCSTGGALVKGAVNSSLEEFALRKEPFELKGRLLSAIAFEPCASKHDNALLFELCRAQALSLAQEALAHLDVELLANGFFEELSADFKGRGREGHCVFARSLRVQALKRIERTHREFSELLAKGHPVSERLWRLQPNMMRLPFVERLLPEGEALRLSARNTMDVVAGAEIDEFLKNERFDETKDVAVFLAPGNWPHPVELANRMPKARMLILEPWPELFSQLIERCQFLHKLPESAQIVGADDALLPGWREVLSRRVRHLQAEGFRFKLFHNKLAERLLPADFAGTCGFGR